MSAFQRKTTSKQVVNRLAGTRLSSTTIITSTGIPSLDDILGGGLPLSCSHILLAPDTHSAYGELVQKYFVAQGLACGQTVCVIGSNARQWVDECMWIPGALPTKDNDEEDTAQNDDKIKIAWRYEQMKMFQTTTTTAASSTEEYCRTLDLTCRIPTSTIEAALQTGVLTLVTEDPMLNALSRIEALLNSETASQATRICIPSLGSPHWGDVTPQDMARFLYHLRQTLRRYPTACASLSLSPHMCTESWGGPGWIQKIAWLTDAAITLSAFTANPSLAAIFPTHHGLLQIHTLPAPHTLLPPSDKFSLLRGLSSSGSSMGSGENNLAFKCMRKRLVFETLHLDLEGGVGERRTTPSTNAMALEAGTVSHEHEHPEAPLGALAMIQIEVPGGDTLKGAPMEEAATVKTKKPRKKVAFHSERPDLNDF